MPPIIYLRSTRVFDETKFYLSSRSFIPGDRDFTTPKYFQADTRSFAILAPTLFNTIGEAMCAAGGDFTVVHDMDRNPPEEQHEI